MFCVYASISQNLSLSVDPQSTDLLLKGSKPPLSSSIFNALLAQSRSGPLSAECNAPEAHFGLVLSPLLMGHTSKASKTRCR